MAQTKTQKILRYSLYGLVGAGVLGVVGYGLVVRPLQIRSQKQNFDKAEVSLDALAIQIQDKIGKADETKKEKSCDRAHLKSESGPLGCGITVALLYKNSDAVGSNKLMEDVLKLRDGSVRIGSGTAHGSAFVSKNTQSGTQIFYEDIAADDPITCVISYRYPSALDQNTITEDDSFALGLSCNGPAMKEFYPLKD